MSINAFCLSGLGLLSPAGRVAFGDIRNPRIVNTCILAHFRDVVEHLNKASNTIKQGTQSFWFRVHIKSKVYTILWPINCTGALDVKKKKTMYIPYFKNTLSLKVANHPSSESSGSQSSFCWWRALPSSCERRSLCEGHTAHEVCLRSRAALPGDRPPRCGFVTSLSSFLIL